jgi:porphobilinogen synthase
MNDPVPSAAFPAVRPRRLRYHPLVRQLVRETHLAVDDLVLPLFVRHGSGERRPIASMPGHAQLSVEQAVLEVGQALKLGIRSFLLFGIPEFKDAVGSPAYAPDNLIAAAVEAIKKVHREVLLITDECFCEYTDHGHCGILTDRTGRLDVDNDATLEILARQCVLHAQAGADVIAPSGMLDGMVQCIRKALDAASLTHVPILSYAAKYSSAFYGPFRDAAESPPRFGSRDSYQMDPANSDEALREVALDLAEGADMVMIKPALSYLDIIRRVKDRFGVPTAAYNVSGEFAMVKAAAANGWIDERKIILEILTSIKRAGADVVITYHAKEVAGWLK